MKFEEWKKCVEGLFSIDREARNLIGIYLNDVMKLYNFDLTPDCECNNGLYSPWVILGKIAWIEKYSQCVFIRYIHSTKMINVFYNDLFIALIRK